MTLRELINSVDSEQYGDNQLYQKLREIKPEYGSSKHIQVKVVDGEIAITNLHVGSLGDDFLNRKPPISGATLIICRRRRLSDSELLH